MSQVGKGKGGADGAFATCSTAVLLSQRKWDETKKKYSGRTLYAHRVSPSFTPGPPVWSVVGGVAFVAGDGDGV